MCISMTFFYPEMETHVPGTSQETFHAVNPDEMLFDPNLVNLKESDLEDLMASES